MSVLRAYEDLHDEEREIADAVWECYRTHTPDLHKKLSWNPENHWRPFSCGEEHNEGDLAGHVHNYSCSKWPDDFKDQLGEITRKEQKPFPGYWHDSESLDGIPTLEPILEGFLYKKTLNRVVGHSASFKSFVMLSMAAHMGWGAEWFGHRVQSEGIRTLIVVAEGAEGIRKRKLALEQYYGRVMENVSFLTKAIQIDRGENRPDWQNLRNAIKDQKIDLLVLDTQSRCTAGLEENSNKEMSEVVNSLDALIAETGVCVVLVHHSTGDQSTTGGNLKGRGAGAVKAALQSEIFIRRDRKQNLVTVETSKAKDDGTSKVMLEPIIREVDGVLNYWGEPESSVVLVSPAPRIKGIKGEPSPATRVETVEELSDRFQQEAPDEKPTVANVRATLGIRQDRAQQVSRYLREEIA
ncbi:AAA family ATPase [Streptomyces sp. NPDC048142]|uniref:AAA family ATPase n=1 Tax=Streptomyces sp. NPDC048142 TaxID=3365501 RepID=UPI0037105D9C